VRSWRGAGRIALAEIAVCALVALAPGPVSAQFREWPEANRPEPGVRLIGNIYYVGTNELAAYLIVTPEGSILVDGGTPASARLIEASMAGLGFKVTDIKYLLTTQAHFDHVGSMAELARKSGGQVLVMAGDADLVERGGRGDYLFGDGAQFPPVHVGRVLRDGDEVRLGGTTLLAHLTPGHTRGCTTWTTTVKDGDATRSVVFAGSTSVNPGTHLVHDPSYPGIRADYERTFRIQHGMHPDVFLAAHTGMFGFEEKRTRLAAGADPNPFIDPDGFAAFVTDSEQRFQELVATEADGVGPH
jgi:metallo-beta-lactamase class B